MRERSYDFLKRLLDTPGPSGFEIGAARVWRKEMEDVADEVRGDVSGNSIATLKGGDGPRVMLAGHIDEIGLMIVHIDDDGFLYVDGIGGWDPQVLVGQRVRLLTKQGEVPGVIGKKPIHLMKQEERTNASKMEELWVDVGADGRDRATEMGVRVGDPAVLDTSFVELGGGKIVSRSIDNRIGAFVVAEALRLLAEEGDRPTAEVSAVATSQEEIGSQGGGARSSAFSLEPDIALVVDVTFASDVPGVEKKTVGDHRIGGGPVLSRGSSVHPLVFERLAEIAEREDIPVTLQANARHSRTDADAIYLTRAGVATGLVSVPNRYMHSPNELVSLDDLEATSRLLAAFCRDLTADTDFVPR